MLSNRTIYTIGGTVQAGHGIYIHRQADETLLSLCRAGNFAYVLTARQMGKSSLMVQTATTLQAEGFRTAIVDVTELGVNVEAEAWYLGLLTRIAARLRLQNNVLQWWQEQAQLGFTQRLTMFFQEIVLGEIAEPILIFVDEIDSTLSLTFTDDFFAAIRYLYNARAIEPELQRLSFVLLGVAIPGDLISDPQRTPFNIGQRVELSDFSTEETLPLVKGFAAASHEARQVVQWILHWTGGHPYLTQRLCAYIAQQQWNPIEKEQVEGAVATLFYGEQSEQDNNLQFVRDMLTRRAPDLLNTLATYRSIHRGERVRDDEQSLVKSHLKLSGIIHRYNNLLHVRNRIYQEVFDQRWIKDHWPLRWWASIPRGIKIASGLVLLLSIALFFTTIWAVQGQEAAREAGATALTAQATTVAAESTAVAERDIAKTQRNEALVGQLVAQSQNYVDTQMDLAVLLSLEANRRSDRAEVRSILPAVMEANPELMTYLRGHQETISQIALSTDGNRLVSADYSGMINFWDIKSGKILKKIQSDSTFVPAIALNSDGTLLAVGGANGKIYLWNAITYQQIDLLLGHKDSIASISFHPNKNQLASSSLDGKIILWDVSTGQQLALYQSVSQPPPIANFAPDGKTIAIFSDSGLLLWDISTDEEILIPDSEGFSPGFQFSPNGKTIALFNYTDEVMLLDVATMEKIKQCYGEPSADAIAFSSDGNLLAISSRRGSISICDVQTGNILDQLQGHIGGDIDLVFTPAGDQLISVDDKTIVVWNLASAAPRLHRSLPVDSVTSITFAPDGKTLASGSLDGLIQIWDTVQDTEPLQLRMNYTSGVDATFANNGQSLIIRDFANTKIVVWDIGIGQAIQQYEFPNEAISHIVYDNYGRLLASGCTDGIFVIWEIDTKKRLGVPSEGCEGGISPNFSADGTLLALYSGNILDGTIMVWDIMKQQQRHEIKIRSPYDNPSSVWLPYSNNHIMLAYSGVRTGVNFWDITTGQQVNIDVNVDDFIFPTQLVLSQDGSKLVINEYRKNVAIYDTMTNSLLFEIQGNSKPDRAIVISNNGDYLAFFSQSSDGSSEEIRLWHLDFEEWRKKACRFVNRNLSQEEWQRFFGDEPYRETCPGLSSLATP